MKRRLQWKLRIFSSLVIAHGSVNAVAAENSSAVTELAEIKVTGQATTEGTAEQGYRVDSINLGPLGRGSFQDTPFSLNAISAELIKNTQAVNSTEALKYVPTVYSNTGSSQITPYFTLRGFSASTWSYNMAVDGMRSFDIYQPMEDKERIEVMGGASSFLYGVTSPAGVVNYLIKRPTAMPLREVTLGRYDRQTYGQIDVGGPLAFNPDLAYRFNLAYGDKGDTGIDHQTQERQVWSGALDWKINPATKLALDASWSKRELDYAQALFMTTAAIGIPAAPDATKNFGASYTGAVDATTRFGVGLESRLNDIFSVRARARHSDIEREFILNRVVWQNSNLDYKWRLDSQQKFHTYVDQYALFLDADFATGPLVHKVTIGGSQDDFDKGYDGARSQTFATVYPGNLYGSPAAPSYSVPSAGASVAQRTKYGTLMLIDQITLGEQWGMMLGATQGHVDDKGYSKNVTTGVVTTTAYEKDKTTPAISLSFKPVPALTTYISYVEALQQAAPSTSTGNAGTIFSPYVSKQKETGVKASLAGLSLNLAYFQIDQANQFIDPTTQITSQDGREIHKGWEFSLSGKASERLTLVGGFTALDARVDKATANVGKTPQGVPERMARLYAEYDLPAVPGLVLTGGASYTGKVPWDAANTLYVNSVTIWDAGLRYQTRAFEKEMTWRLGISNLGGKDYWTTRSGILYLGSPRTLSLSASLAF